MASEDRTEQATPRRRSEAHGKGQVAKSAELNSVAVLLAAYVLFLTWGTGVAHQLEQFMSASLGNLAVRDLTVDDAHTLGMGLSFWVGGLLLPFVGAIMAAGVAIGVFQGGLIFNLSAIMPKLSRLNPADGIKRLFSVRAIPEAIKNFLKVVLLGYLAYGTVSGRLLQMMTLSAMDLPTGLSFLVEFAKEVFLKLVLALLLIAGFDFAWQRFKLERDLKMTKEEVKEEIKQTEGNPQTKTRIRRRQRQIAQQRMMQKVPKADVVITNPTHLAIAIQYDAARMKAPVVVAKGERLVAEQIKRVAAQHGVPTIENKPLAQALYKTVEIGSAIPAELYQAVAEVLAFIYRLRAPVAHSPARGAQSEPGVSRLHDVEGRMAVNLRADPAPHSTGVR